MLCHGISVTIGCLVHGWRIVMARKGTPGKLAVARVLVRFVWWSTGVWLAVDTGATLSSGTFALHGAPLSGGLRRRSALWQHLAQ